MLFLKSIVYIIIGSYHTFKLKFISVIVGPYLNIYDTIHAGTITQVDRFDCSSLEKHCVYNIPIVMHVVYAVLYACGQLSWLNDMLLEDYSPGNDNNNKKYIYRIVCWDGKQYLVNQYFSMIDRPSSSSRHKYLHVSLNDIDITHFVNDYISSFENKLIGDMTVSTFNAIVLLMNDHILYSKVVKEPYLLYTIHSDTLEVQTYHNINGTLVL